VLAHEDDLEGFEAWYGSFVWPDMGH